MQAPGMPYLYPTCDTAAELLALGCFFYYFREQLHS